MGICCSVESFVLCVAQIFVLQVVSMYYSKLLVDVLFFYLLNCDTFDIICIFNVEFGQTWEVLPYV